MTFFESKTQSIFKSQAFDLCSKRSLTVAFPEGDDTRVEKASVQLLQKKYCKSVVVWTKNFQLFKKRISEEVAGFVDNMCIDGATLIQPIYKEFESSLRDFYTAKKKVPDAEIFKAQLSDPLFQAGFLLKQKKVSCAVAGSIATTAQVIRAALATVGMEDQVKTVCGGFVMTRGEALFVFADGAVVVDPSSEQLSDIASASVNLWKKISKDDPRVAFLSFSTRDSAAHPHVDKMKQAYQLFRAKFPKVIADGELQLDAAIVPEVANRKASGSAIEGKANILIFPDLNAGNIGYKLAQRLGGFEAYGPILLGLSAPYSDLSRGASVDDIVMAACLSMVRAN